MSEAVMFNCRFPFGVREALANSARANGRSQSAEIISMLAIEPTGPLPQGLEAVGARSGYQFGLRMPADVHAMLQDHARRSGRSMQGELLFRVMSALSQNGHLLDGSEAPHGSDAQLASSSLVYRPPSQTPQQTSRRVYVLPIELVQRIHEYGYANGHQSEVSAVRELLESALNAKGGAS